MSNDPWKHRSENMKCKSCMWFVPKIVNRAEVGPPIYDMGRCRRHAPSMNGYPVVMVNDWCGDHKLDENKYFNLYANESIQKAQMAQPGQWRAVNATGNQEL